LRQKNALKLFHLSNKLIDLFKSELPVGKYLFYDANVLALTKR